MTFRVGQKVVCVDAKPFPPNFCWHDTVTAPTEGSVYTVARGNYVNTGSVVIDLCELPNPRGYRAIRFRPVVERKTDIGFAHEILRKATHKQGVDA